MVAQLLATKWTYWSTYGNQLTQFLLSLDIPFIPLPPKKRSNGASQAVSIIYEVFGKPAAQKARSETQPKASSSRTPASREAKRPNTHDLTSSTTSPSTSSDSKRRRLESDVTPSAAPGVAPGLSHPALLFRTPMPHIPFPVASHPLIGATPYQQYSQVLPAFQHPYVTPNATPVFTQFTAARSQHSTYTPLPPSHASYVSPSQPTPVTPNANNITPYSQMYDTLAMPNPSPFHSAQTTLPSASRTTQGPSPPTAHPQTPHRAFHNTSVRFDNTFASSYTPKPSSSQPRRSKHS